MLTIKIINDGTGSAEIGNYDVSVAINDKPVWRGRVEGHYRPRGWLPLVDEAVWQMWQEEEESNDGQA